MKQLVIFLLCALMLTGCKSRRTAVKENIKIDAIENVDKTEKTTQTDTKVEKMVKDVKTNIAGKTVTRTTETEYSAPDASGKQHKTREKTTEMRNDVQTTNEANERAISEQKSEIERLRIDKSELQTKLDVALSEKTKTTTRAPFWTYIVAAVTGAGGALLVRRWIRTRFRF